MNASAAPRAGASTMGGDMFFIDGLVRDSELDSQGGVANDRIMEYLQHARHEYFRTKGFSLKQLIADQVDPVLRESHIRYLTSLEHGDHYRVTVVPVRAGVKLHFLCGIFRLSDMALCVKAIMTVVVSKAGQLTRDNILGVDEGPGGRSYEPSFKDIPDRWEPAEPGAGE